MKMTKARRPHCPRVMVVREQSLESRRSWAVLQRPGTCTVSGWRGRDTQLQLGRDTEELLSPGMVKNTRLRCIMQTLEKGELFPDSWSELPSGETRFPSVSKFTSKRFFRKELFPSFVLYTLPHMRHFRRLDFIQS